MPQPQSTISADNINEMVKIAAWRQGGVSNFALLPDGKTIALAFSTGVLLYDIQTGTQKLNITTEYPVLALALSPDGTILATGGIGNSVELWEVSNGHLISTLKAPKEPYYSRIRYLEFSPDGQVLIFSNDFWMRDAYLWRVQDGNLIRTFENTIAPLIVISPDGQTIAIPSAKGVQLQRLNDGTVTGEFTASNVTKITFSHNGEILAVVSGEVIRLFRLSDSKLIGALSGSRLSFSPDGKTITTDNNKRSVHLWQLIDDGSRYILNTTFSGSGFGNYLWGAEIGNAGVFSPDGQYFALMHKGKNITDSSGNVTRESDRLRIFHISDNVLIQKIHADYTDDVIFSPDATFLVSWTGREGFENGIGSVQVWNLGNGSSVFTSGQVYKEHYAAPEMTIRFLAFSSDSMGLYYADLGEGGLKLVNIQDGKQTVIGYPCMMSILDGIDPGQDFSNCDTNLLELYNAESAISIQGDKLAISNREDIKIYSYPKLELLNILQGLGENVCELTFSPDGMMLVASLGDTCGLGGNRIRTIHVNGEIGQEFDIKGLISDIKLLPDGRSFIGRIREGYFSSIGIWDLSNGQLIRKFDTGNFRFYALSSSGNILATSKDTQWYSEINFWNVEDGVHLRTIYTPFRRPPPLSFSPDGTMFAAGYLDGTIHIWGVKP